MHSGDAGEGDGTALVTLMLRLRLLLLVVVMAAARKHHRVWCRLRANSQQPRQRQPMPLLSPCLSRTRARPLSRLLSRAPPRKTEHSIKCSTVARPTWLARNHWTDSGRLRTTGTCSAVDGSAAMQLRMVAPSGAGTEH